MDYSLDDASGDTSLSSFSIANVPSNVFTVLNDIKAINEYTKVLITPWSPVRRSFFSLLSWNLMPPTAWLDEE
jgi:hypothetical protein